MTILQRRNKPQQQRAVIGWPAASLPVQRAVIGWPAASHSVAGGRFARRSPRLLNSHQQ